MATLGVFVAEQQATGLMAPIERQRAESVFLEILDATHRESRPVSDNVHAGDYAPKLFSQRPERQGLQRKDFQRVMEVLFSGGAIKVEEYGRPGDPQAEDRSSRGADAVSWPALAAWSRRLRRLPASR